MFDLKVMKSVLSQLEDERGITADQIIVAIEEALAHAYRKEYGKRGQIVRAKFDIETGTTEFFQVKVVADETTVYIEEEIEGDPEVATSPSKKEAPSDSPRQSSSEAGETKEEGDERVRFNPEHHILIDDANKIKKGAKVGDELIFPLEMKDDFGRIAAQTAKQVMIQKIREAEKTYLSKEFGKREGEIVNGSVQRIERGNLFVDLGRATGILPYEEQIPGERYKQGERIRAFLYRVEETPRGIFLKLSRSHPQFLEKLFEIEAPEVANEVVELKAIAREAGSRSKVAVYSNDDHIDPVGSLVGQRGVRVSTVMSELGGEKIDIVEWSDSAEEFIEDSLSPAKVLEVEITNEEERQAIVRVSEDQQSLAIGRGGQNVRLAAKLTGWRIDIQSVGGETVAEADDEGEVSLTEPEDADTDAGSNPDSAGGKEGEVEIKEGAEEAEKTDDATKQPEEDKKEKEEDPKKIDETKKDKEESSSKRDQEEAKENLKSSDDDQAGGTKKDK